MMREGRESERKQVAGESSLPNQFAALRFVCGCFGIEMPQMGAMLKTVREREKGPDKYFPRALNRVMLNEAERGLGRWCQALEILGHEALYDRIRRQKGEPLFGFTGDLTEQLGFGLLRLYQKIVPRLKTEGVSIQNVLWVLAEEVFVPALFVELAENWQSGLGTELRIETCWYLPVAEGRDVVKPVSRVLRCWLKAAGFRYAYDFGKLNDSVRRKVERWLKGDCVPEIGEAHALVEKFADEVSWLDGPDDWKTRFTLACAMQKLCGAIDKFFEAGRGNCSLKLADTLRAIPNERIAVDDGRVLFDRETFFAARLLQRRLQREGRWGPEVSDFVKDWHTMVPAGASRMAIDAFRREHLWRMNPGNWFLRFIGRELGDVNAARMGKAALENSEGLQAGILNIGIAELNRILDLKRGQRAGARQP